MISLTVIGLFIVGTAIGISLRKKKSFIKINEPLISLAVLALLFFLGISVGSDPRITNNITTLGWQAIALSSGAILGSLILAGLTTSWFHDSYKRPETFKATGKSSGTEKIKLLLTNQSVWILFIFSAGIAGAALNLLPVYLGNEKISTFTLYILMILVGLGIGSDPRAGEILKRTRLRIIIVPLIVIIGSLGGSYLISFFIAKVNAANGMAVGAGFGYYSLSAIIIGKISGNDMGVIALLANIFREVITLVAAPLWVKWFGRLGAIVSGGATAMDTTLPVIIRVTGKEYAVISIFSGIVLSVLVPVLVPLILDTN